MFVQEYQIKALVNTMLFNKGAEERFLDLVSKDQDEILTEDLDKEIPGVKEKTHYLGREKGKEVYLVCGYSPYYEMYYAKLIKKHPKCKMI